MIFVGENCVDGKRNAKSMESLNKCCSFYLYCCQNRYKWLKNRKKKGKKMIIIKILLKAVYTSIILTNSITVIVVGNGTDHLS